jgi:hypothetical protein
MVLQAAIEGLNATIGKAIGRIENAIAISDQAQKASLALGQSLAGGSRTLDNSIRDLKGAFGNTLQAQLVALNSGLQGNVAGIGKLINQQQLTGGNFKATARSLATLELALGLTKDQLNNLAVATIETGKKYGVSTDKLIASIDSFSDNFAALELAGMGDGFINAATKISAQVGPAVEKQLGSVLRFLTDPSIEALAKKSALGLGNLMESLGPDASPEAIQAALASAAQHIENMAGNTSQFFAGMGVVEKRFGKVASDILIINRALGERQEIEARNQGEFFDQISVLKNQILAPLDKLFSDELFPKVKEFVDLLGRVAKPIIENIESRIRKFLSDPALAIGNFVKNLDKVQVGFTKVINGMITGVNLMTRGMLKFIEQLNEIWTIDMLPDSAAEMSKAIKKERSEVSAQTGVIAELQETLHTLKTGAVPGSEFLTDKQRINAYVDALERVPNNIQIQVSNAMLHGGKTREEADKLQIKLLQDHLVNLTKDRDAASRALKEQEAFLEDFFMKTADKIELQPFELVPDRFAKAHGEMLGEIATNTAATAENTEKEDDLADRLPFMLDQSIVSLGDALLAITRRAVEEPDPLQEAMLSELEFQSRSMASPGRALAPRRRF